MNFSNLQTLGANAVESNEFAIARLGKERVTKTPSMYSVYSSYTTTGDEDTDAATKIYMCVLPAGARITQMVWKQGNIGNDATGVTLDLGYEYVSTTSESDDLDAYIDAQSIDNASLEAALTDTASAFVAPILRPALPADAVIVATVTPTNLTWSANVDLELRIEYSL